MCFWRQLRAPGSAREVQVIPHAPTPNFPAVTTWGSLDHHGIWGTVMLFSGSVSHLFHYPPPTHVSALAGKCALAWEGWWCPDSKLGTQGAAWGERAQRKQFSTQCGHQLSGDFGTLGPLLWNLSVLDMKTHVDERVAFEPVQGLLAWDPCMSFGMVHGSLEIVCNIAAFFFPPGGESPLLPLGFQRALL